MRNVLRSIFGPAGSGMFEKPPAAEFLSEAKFDAQLRLERARSERSLANFVLMHFTVGSPLGTLRKRCALQALTDAVCKRSRAIDVKGEYRGGLGLILPYTSEDKIELIWDDVQRIYAKEFVLIAGEGFPVPPLCCEVVTSLVSKVSEVS